MADYELFNIADTRRNSVLLFFILQRCKGPIFLRDVMLFLREITLVPVEK